MKNKVLKSNRLTIKAFLNEHLEELSYILTNKEIAKTYMIPDFSNEEQVYKLANRFIELSNDESKYVFGVYLNEKLIGFLNEVDKDEISIEIGYVIHPIYQNNGYATEMFKEVIKDLLSNGYQKVKAGFFKENIASKRVMEKCNMKKTDFEEDIEYKGIIHHCIYYEIRKEDINY